MRRRGFFQLILGGIVLIPSIKTFTFGEDLGATELQDGVNAPLNYLYDRPFCNAVRTTNVAITSGGAFKLVTLDGETSDNDTMHSLVTNPNRITFATAGAYMIGAQAMFASGGTGRREIMIRTMANGSPTGGTEIGRGTQGVTNGNSSVMVARPATFGVSNYMEMFVFHDNGTTIDLVGGNENTYMWAFQIST